MLFTITSHRPAPAPSFILH
uniref:Uncharacterized protein n=1 Tax=Rhizophora mucronata TaxID=61149 RepID=A0A2P2R3V4_RHIMU